MRSKCDKKESCAMLGFCEDANVFKAVIFEVSRRDVLQSISSVTLAEMGLHRIFDHLCAAVTYELFVFKKYRMRISQAQEDLSRSTMYVSACDLTEMIRVLSHVTKLIPTYRC